ncbi:unnamed protein product [Diabrotica balteata]|uniref:Zinc carboxypeptidase A 1 n=1 Tax=Diabrotica balteata TaxID=107213 RepID=A0A9N9X9J6_DIABA|nr:unnamed protein product [Diabrotica balteata]
MNAAAVLSFLWNAALINLGKMKLTPFYVLVSLLSLSSAVVRYDNYTLYKIFPKSSDELKVLQNLQRSKEYKLDFWRDPYRVGIPISVLVSPEEKYNFENIISRSNVEFQVLNSNIQEQIDEESRLNRLRSIQQGNLTWDRYYDLEHDRMWRKTRSDYGTGCKGTDANRNWGYKWNELGATNNPCDRLYAGPSAFSEIETKSLSEYMSKVANEILLYISFHSYGQYILLPYGHTRDHLDNYDGAITT